MFSILVKNKNKSINFNVFGMILTSKTLELLEIKHDFDWHVQIVLTAWSLQVQVQVYTPWSFLAQEQVQGPAVQVPLDGEGAGAAWPPSSPADWMAGMAGIALTASSTLQQYM